MTTCLPSPPSSVHSKEESDFPDFAPRRRSNDGNNNAGQQPLSKVALLNVKKERFSQRQNHEEETEEEEENSDGSSEDDDDCYILVRSSREDIDPLEIPISADDGSLPLSILKDYFPGATGLARRKKTGNLRLAYKIVDGSLHPLEKYINQETFEVVWPRKQKRNSDDDEEIAPPGGKKPRKDDEADKVDKQMPFSAAEINFKPNFNFGSNTNAPSFSAVASGAWRKPANQNANRGCFNVSHNGPTAMMVKDVPSGFDVSDLRKYFARFGPLHSVQVDRQRATVRFGDVHSTRQTFGNHCINGADLVALPTGYREDKKASMYMSSIPRGMGQLTLIEYFSNFGPVLYVYIPRQPYGWKKYGFVQFNEEASALRASKNKEHNVNGHSINVNVRRF